MIGPSFSPRIAALVEQLEKRIVVIDGAMGTMAQARKLGEADYRGDRFKDHSRDLKGDHYLLNLTRPDVVESFHREYLLAGADIVETNTFNGTRISQADYHMEDVAHEMNRAGAQLARKAADGVMAEQAGRTCWVAGSLGPTNKTASLSRDVNDPGARGDLRRARGGLPRAGPGPAGRRGGPAPGGDDLRHPERQGRPLRHRAGLRGAGPAGAGDGVGDDLRGRAQPLDPDRRGLLDLGRPLPPVLGGDQLLAGAEADEAVHRGALPDRSHLDQLLPQRRPAQRLRRLRRDPGAAGA